jgi:hypothetical protein
MFTASVIEAILNISPGDHKQFQTVVEIPGVRTRAYAIVEWVLSS